MNPYDFNPYSPFSSDVIYSRGLYGQECDYSYQPEKIVAAQLEKQLSSLPDQLYHHTYRRPPSYNDRQYFASAPQDPTVKMDNNVESDTEDFFEWFVKSNDFYVILLFILIVLVVNFIVVASRTPLFALGIITPPESSSVASVEEKFKQESSTESKPQAEPKP